MLAYIWSDYLDGFSLAIFNSLKNRTHEQIKDIRRYSDNPGSHLGVDEKRIQHIFVSCAGIKKSYAQRNNNESQKEAA